MRKEQQTTCKKPLLPRKENLDFFHALSVVQKKNHQNLGLLFSPFSQAALPNVLVKVALLVCIQLLMYWGL